MAHPRCLSKGKAVPKDAHQLRYYGARPLPQLRSPVTVLQHVMGPCVLAADLLIQICVGRLSHRCLSSSMCHHDIPTLPAQPEDVICLMRSKVVGQGNSPTPQLRLRCREVPI